MGRQSVILFGSASALKSTHAKQLFDELKKKDFEVELCSELAIFREKLSSESIPSTVIAVTAGKTAPSFGAWREALDGVPRTPRVLLWLDAGLQSKSFASLAADQTLSVSEGVQAVLKWMQRPALPNTVSKPLNTPDLSLSFPSEDDADPMEKTRLVPPPKPPAPRASGLSLLSEVPASRPAEAAEDVAKLDLDSFLITPEDVPQDNLISQTATVDAELARPGAELPALQMDEMLLSDAGKPLDDGPTQIAAQISEDATQVGVDLGLAIGAADADVEAHETEDATRLGAPVEAQDPVVPVADEATQLAVADPMASVAKSPAKSPPPKSQALSHSDSIRLQSLEELPSVSFTGQGFGGLSSIGPAAGSGMSEVPLNDEGSETLRRYAALKEREARERENALRVVTSQMAQLKSKLGDSEKERRRLSLALDESDVARRTLEDFKAQAQHQQNRSEAAHQEELRAVQARLDNALFQANRSERKLEEFRERVKQDILQIRLRERELANKLELQKRDAEALLTAKDERLLQQRRELDRLEYEVQLLRERIVEETEKAEDRAARLSRALTSLKLAQGMLSGMHEEVIPQDNPGPLDPSDGEAA